MAHSTRDERATRATSRRLIVEHGRDPIVNDATTEDAVLHQFTKGIELPPLNSLDMEDFISDPRRCSKEVRQEMILQRNAPCLTEPEYDSLMTLHEDNGHNKELDKRPICTICQDAIEKPNATSSEERTDDIAVKLLTAKGFDSPACPDLPTKLQPCSAVPHVFHLGCIREYFFHDPNTETVTCPNCCTEIYDGQGGYRVWGCRFVLDEQTGKYVEYSEPNLDDYSDDEDGDADNEGDGYEDGYASQNGSFFLGFLRVVERLMICEENFSSMNIETPTADEDNDIDDPWTWNTRPNDNMAYEEIDTSQEAEDKEETRSSPLIVSRLPEDRIQLYEQESQHQRPLDTWPDENNADEHTDVSDEAEDEGRSADPPTVDLRQHLCRSTEDYLLSLTSK